MKINDRVEVVELFDEYSGVLTQNQKQAIQLRFFEDLTFGEIADIVATSRAAVNDAINKGIKKMKKIHNQIHN